MIKRKPSLNSQCRWLILGIGIIFPLLGCNKKPLEPIRFGINPWPGYEFVYLASVKGFFAKRGVDVQVMDFSSLNDNRVAYERGQIDGMGCTLIEMLRVLDGGRRKPVAVLPSDYSNGADMILANPAITEVKDLAHKRIAIEPGTLNIYILSRALEKVGLSLDSVELVSIPMMEVPSRWKDAKIDAAVTYPPFSVELIAGGMKQIFSTREIPREVLDILVFDREILNKRPEDIRKFLAAYEDARQYWLTHRMEVDSLFAAKEGIPTSDFTSTIDKDIHVSDRKEMSILMAPGGAVDQSLSQLEPILHKIGYLKNSLPDGDWIDGSFLP